MLFKKEAQELDKRYVLKGEALSKIQEENVLTVYNEQTKKNLILCQLEFDFYGENGSLTIDEFRFTPRLKVADLQKLENRINKKY